MKWIRLSGWALIPSALIFLFGFAWDHVINGPFTLVTIMIGLLGFDAYLLGKCRDIIDDDLSCFA